MPYPNEPNSRDTRSVPVALLVAAVCGLLTQAASARAEDGNPLRADDVERWVDDPCPLASALGPSLDAQGSTEVEATNRVVRIRFAGEEQNALEFSVRKGEDLDAMRDTLLGSCTRTPGVTGVPNVRLDLREAFESSDNDARASAVRDAVDKLRAQRTKMADTVRAQQTACAARLPTPPREPQSLTTLAAIQAHLKALAEADAALSAAAEACRVVDRARTFAPDLVTTSDTAQRGVRDNAAVGSARLSEARASLVPRMVDLCVDSGAKGDPECRKVWDTLVEGGRTAVLTSLEECKSTGNCGAFDQNGAFCGTVITMAADSLAEVDKGLFVGFVQPYVGGSEWCSSTAGSPACAAARKRLSEKVKDTVRTTCVETYMKAGGPDIARAAQQKKQAAAAEEARKWMQLAAEVERWAGPDPGCEWVYTCTCQTDGRQMTSREGCPYGFGAYGCEDDWNSERHQECD